jgi:glycosyltransferase involved in cell wall biosynthesis
MSYGARNVSYGAAHPGLRFARAPFVPFHRLRRLDATARHRTWAFPLGGTDLVHVYNDVCRSTRPWVASFEHRYPAEDTDVGRRARAVRLAAGPRCRRLLAISEHTRRLLASDPLSGPDLLPKCEVVYPCVPPEDDVAARHAAWLAQNPPDRGVRLLFVGNEFFRKGGEFVLDAAEGLAERLGVPVRLTVVSTLASDSYLTRASPDRVRSAAARLARRPGAERVQDLPPRAVRERMARSHVLVHPSLDETFGFVVVEAMATGLDVVTTRLRAVPEIVPPDLLPETVDLPTNADEEWAGTRLDPASPERARLWEDARDRCVAAIRSRVEACLRSPSLLAERAASLRARYEQRFTPEVLGRRLFDVYSRALGRL